MSDLATALKPSTAAPAETAPVRKPLIDSLGRSYGTGKKKEAIARVWVKRGKGEIIVNGRAVTTYFARPVLRMIINQPFETISGEGQYDIMATVHGGGLSSQAYAIRHGLSKALSDFDPENRPALKGEGFLTRDSRVVERKKYGLHKARRGKQWAKR